MSNELNITSGEAAGNIAETSTGENTGVISDNKIVPIANKTNAVEPAADPIPSAADAGASIPAQAAAPVIQAPVPDVQTSAVPAQPITGSTATTIPEQAASENQAAPQTATETQTSAASSQTTAESLAQSKAQESEAAPKRISSTSSYREDREDSFDFDEDDRPKKRFFRSRHEEESRDKLILSRINDDDLLEYLALEQRRLEFLQQAKETREKRLLMAFQLLISLAAIVAVTYLLKDNPTILISILYIVGIIAALIIWKNPHDKGKWRH